MHKYPLILMYLTVLKLDVALYIVCVCARNAELQDTLRDRDTALKWVDAKHMIGISKWNTPQ